MRMRLDFCGGVPVATERRVCGMLGMRGQLNILWRMTLIQIAPFTEKPMAEKPMIMYGRTGVGAKLEDEVI